MIIIIQAQYINTVVFDGSKQPHYCLEVRVVFNILDKIEILRLSMHISNEPPVNIL